MNYSFHLWQILAVAGVLFAIDVSGSWFGNHFELDWSRPLPRVRHRWYGKNAHVVLRGDEDDEDPGRYAVIEFDLEHAGVPWLKVHLLDPDSNYWDDNAEVFWAPVTQFAPYTVRRLRPYIAYYGRVPVPWLIQYLPLRRPVRYLEAGS